VSLLSRYGTCRLPAARDMITCGGLRQFICLGLGVVIQAFDCRFRDRLREDLVRFKGVNVLRENTPPNISMHCG
jgi:hypothetical protein